MGFVRNFISALRLRTVPLALSGASLGCMLAAADFHVRPASVCFVLLTAALLQIVSNVSNELGDFRRGVTSGHGRTASESLTCGDFSADDLKKILYVLVFLTVVSGLAMIYFSFGTIFSLDAFVLMIIGYMAISASMRYTLGKNPYGYRGLGDLYVFMFFGIVSVVGAYFVCAHTFGSAKLLLPAVSAGLLSVAVLNVNNLRDIENDRAVKVTVAGRLGGRGARIYQTALIALAWISMSSYAMLCFSDPWHWLFTISFPLFAWHLAGIWRSPAESLDKYLPQLVLSSLLFCLLAGTGFLVYLII